jgi:iron complex transport system substrate-binding protein
MKRRTTTLLALAAVALATLVGAPAAPAAPQGDTEPERIVSISPTATEILFAIGAGDQVVAVDDQSDYPPGVPTTDLSSFEPNAEAVAGYDPDLVVMSTGEIADSLDELEIDTLVQSAPKRLRGAYRQIRELGDVTGHEDEADEVVDQIKSDIADLRDRVPGRDEKPTAYYELDDQYFSVTSATFIGQLLSLAGLANIADEAEEKAGGYPQLSAEYIIDTDPDYILLADTECCGQNAETVAARPGWSDIAAVSNDNVVLLQDDIASRWGPRVVDLLRTIVEATSTP